jgi:hypothetical protein
MGRGRAERTRAVWGEIGKREIDTKKRAESLCNMFFKKN